MCPNRIWMPAPAEDDALVLLFMCCHPALTPSSAIALTLRAVGGLTTAEIANAFLVPEATMAQRISRAKQTIKASGIPFQMPDAEDRGARLRSVLHVLYLIFNEGYTASSGPHLRRADLSREGIRLTRMALSAAARKYRDRRAARAHAVDRRAPPCPNRPQRRTDSAGAAGSDALGSATDRGRSRPALGRPAARRRRAVSVAGSHRRCSR